MTPQQKKATLQKLGPFIALLLVATGLAIMSPDFFNRGQFADRNAPGVD